MIKGLWAEVKLRLNRASVEGVEKDAQGALKKGTDPKAAEQNLGAVGKAFTKLRVIAVAAAAAIVGALVVGLRRVIAATSEQQRVNAQLEATLRSTGMAAGRTAEQLRAQADEMQRLTAFSNEQIQSAQNLLLTFKQLREEEFDRAVEITADLATAMGTDLRSAAMQLGRALEDPTVGLTALRRSGISFSQAQIDVIRNLTETGRAAEAQRLILKELEAQVGGSAAAYRNTLGGALAALGNAFADLFKVAEDNTNGIISIINRITERLEQWQGFLDRLITGFRRWVLETKIGFLEIERVLRPDRIRQIDWELNRLRETLRGIGEDTSGLDEHIANFLRRRRTERAQEEERERLAREAAQAAAEAQAKVVEEMRKREADRINLLIRARDLRVAEQDEVIELINLYQKLNREMAAGISDTGRRVQVEELRGAVAENLGIFATRDVSPAPLGVGRVPQRGAGGVSAALSRPAEPPPWAVWMLENLDTIEHAGVRAAWGITTAFEDAFSALILEGRGLGAMFEEIFRGTAGAVAGMLADVASTKVAENVASAIQATATGLFAAATGNAAGASLAFAAAKQHGAAALAWGVLAGGAGAAQRATGGQSGGIPSGARDPIGRMSDRVERGQVEINIRVDGVDPRNPRHQDLIGRTQREAERRGYRVRFG